MARRPAGQAGSARVTIRCSNCTCEITKGLEDDTPPVCPDVLECEHRVLLMKMRLQE